MSAYSRRVIELAKALRRCPAHEFVERAHELWASLDEQHEGPDDTVADGFGYIWQRCHENCQLQIVRPGKVQCECDGIDDATKAKMLATPPEERCNVIDCYEPSTIGRVRSIAGVGDIYVWTCHAHAGDYMDSGYMEVGAAESPNA